MQPSESACRIMCDATGAGMVVAQAAGLGAERVVETAAAMVEARA